MELNDTSFFYWLYYYLNYYEMMKNWKLLWQVIFGDSAKTKQRGSLSLTTPHACKMMSLLYILFHRTCSSIVEPEAWPQIMEYGMLFMWHTTYVSETEITVLQKLYYHYKLYYQPSQSLPSLLCGAMYYPLSVEGTAPGSHGLPNFHGGLQIKDRLFFK